MPILVDSSQKVMELSCKYFHETQTQIISSFNLPLMKGIKNITHKNYFVTYSAAEVINKKQKTAITNSLPNMFSQHSKTIIGMSGIVPPNLKKKYNQTHHLPRSSGSQSSPLFCAMLHL